MTTPTNREELILWRAKVIHGLLPIECVSYEYCKGIAEAILDGEEEVGVVPVPVQATIEMLMAADKCWWGSSMWRHVLPASPFVKKEDKQ